MANTSLPFTNSKTKICSVSGCGCEVHAVLMCQKHYRRVRRYGDPFAVHRHKHGRTPTDPIPRFFAKVRKTKRCWLWTAATVGGYGSFDGGLAHRFSFFLATGRKPTHDVLHSCDVPLCVRPDHLVEGTHADNMADRNVKGRQAHGENSGRALLTELQVIDIRNEYKKGSHKVGASALATRFGVSTSAVQAIVTGRSWAHLPLKKL